MRIVHLSDVHVWRYVANPLQLFNKRALGMANLLAGRAARFRLERLDDVVARIVSLAADHILITGDLTTTAHPSEFVEALRALEPLLRDTTRATVLPGNHDRYTSGSVRDRTFERFFGGYSPPSAYPWLRQLDERTAILGLDPTRAHLSARGRLPSAQIEAMKRILANWSDDRLIIASHYPLSAPPDYARELSRKRQVNAAAVIEALKSVAPHIYCCGHVHAAWAFQPLELPNQLCLNAGAPLLRDLTGHRSPGFLEIELSQSGVLVNHHAWITDHWAIRELYHNPTYFRSEA